MINMKINVNPRLIPICVNFFFLTNATGFSFPYISLQMRTLGLSLDDVALIMGLVPFFAFILAPLLGYVGDKLGYKMVMVAGLLLYTVTLASFTFTPSYRQHFSKVALHTGSEKLNFSIEFDINNVIWFGRYLEEGFDCNDTLDNLTVSITRIECDSGVYEVDLKLDLSDVPNTTKNECTDVDRDFCKYEFKEDVLMENVLFCSVLDGDGKRTVEQGSHSLTLWTYFFLFTCYKILVNVNYNISDATAATLAKKENSSYSIIFWFGQVGTLIPSFTVGQLVDHVNFGSSYMDLSLIHI